MATRTQGAVQWRKDDGTEVTATNAVALNASLAGSLDTNYRLRLTSDLGGTGSFTWKPQLQYNKNNAGWNDVNAASSVARSSASPNVADNAATTNQITVNAFTAGQFDEVDGVPGSSVTLSDTGNTGTEHEYCLQVRSADVVSGDIILFRIMVSGGGAYDTYSNYGTFTVGSGITNKGNFFNLWD
jgi:hypothetical protein